MGCYGKKRVCPLRAVSEEETASGHAWESADHFKLGALATHPPQCTSAVINTESYPCIVSHTEGNS